MLNEPKTRTYFMQPFCLLNADGGQLITSEATNRSYYAWVEWAMIKRRVPGE